MSIAAAGDFGPLVFLFTQITLAVAISALLGTLIVWFPENRMVDRLVDTSNCQLGLIACVCGVFVAAGIIAGLLYAAGVW